MDNGIDVVLGPLALTREQDELVKRAFAGRSTEADRENLEYLAVECLDESGCGQDADDPWEAISHPAPEGCPGICGALCLTDPEGRW